MTNKHQTILRVWWHLFPAPQRWQTPVASQIPSPPAPQSRSEKVRLWTVSTFLSPSCTQAASLQYKSVLDKDLATVFEVPFYFILCFYISPLWKKTYDWQGTPSFRARQYGEKMLCQTGAPRAAAMGHCVNHNTANLFFHTFAFKRVITNKYFQCLAAMDV